MPEHGGRLDRSAPQHLLHSGKFNPVILRQIHAAANKLLAGLAVKVLTVDDEEALVDALVGLKQRRSLEGGERLARAGRVPDISVAAVLIDAVDNRLDCYGRIIRSFCSLAMRTMYLLIIWPSVHLARNRSAKSSRWVILVLSSAANW
jgi:hypothetical protein